MALRVRQKLLFPSLALLIVLSFGFAGLGFALSRGWVEDDLRERAVTFAREMAATIGERREFENAALMREQIQRILLIRPNVLQLDILAFGAGATRLVASTDEARRLPFTRADAARVRGAVVSHLVTRRDTRTGHDPALARRSDARGRGPDRRRDRRPGAAADARGRPASRPPRRGRPAARPRACQPAPAGVPQPAHERMAAHVSVACTGSARCVIITPARHRDAIARTITTLPAQLRRSPTWDQGAERGQHARLQVDTGVTVYFCDPHSPWQRGTNENTNGLLRQYFPKGTDLSAHSTDALAAVAFALNTRPRKTLRWRTPAEALDGVLRSAHTGGVATVG